MILLMTSSVSYAQEPIARVDNSVPIDEAHVHPSTVADKKFWLLGAALNVGMVLDTKSTFDVARRCASCYEANPVVAPFLPLGPAPVFAAGEMFDVGVMAVAAKMKGSSHEAVRRTWWVIPVVLTTGHLLAYRHNQALAR